MSIEKDNKRAWQDKIMSQTINILYVDNISRNRTLVRNTMEQEDGGFHVTEAGSRREFEALFAQGNYDIVLSAWRPYQQKSV